MSLQSVPVNPPVPDLASYDIGKLWTVKRFTTREIFLKEFGEQAPSFDPSRRKKFWFDSTALEGRSPDELVSYNQLVYTADGPTFKTLVMTAQEAATVNLPGIRTYAPYKVAPTPAVIVNPDGSKTPVGPTFLSTVQEAEALAAELGGTVVDGTGGVPYSWNGETRRPWAIKYTSRDGNNAVNLLNVGSLLAVKNAYGVGKPGRWDFAGMEPAWFPLREETGEQDARPEIPMPVRKLASNEKFHVTPFGTTIYRTDKESPFNPKPVATGGGLTPDQEALLKETNENVKKILKLMVNV